MRNWIIDALVEHRMKNSRLFDSWQESKHPRDDQGRFIEKNSIDFKNHTGKAELKDIYRIAKSRNDPNKSFSNIAKVSDDVVQKVFDVTGLDIQNWVHGIDESAIRHIFKKHGNPKTETSRGQIAVTENDILNLETILNQPDSVEYGGLNDRGNETLIFKKKIENQIVCIQEVRNGHKKLSVTSIWIKKVAS